MTEELAFLLGAYASEGCTVRSNYTVRITNSVPVGPRPSRRRLEGGVRPRCQGGRRWRALSGRRRLVEDRGRVPRVPRKRQQSVGQAHPGCRAALTPSHGPVLPGRVVARRLRDRRLDGEVGDLPRLARDARRPPGRADEPRHRPQPHLEVERQHGQVLRRGVRHGRARRAALHARAVPRAGQGRAGVTTVRPSGPPAQHGRRGAGFSSRLARTAPRREAGSRLRGPDPLRLQLPARPPHDVRVASHAGARGGGRVHGCRPGSR